MLSVREALDLLVPQFSPLSAEPVALPEAVDRVLAGALTAQTDLPAFDHSAMDGYALAHAVAQAGTPLAISAEIKAGDRPQPLAAGTVARIFTGAPLPEGADTVVIQENTTRDGASVTLHSLPDPGANVRHRGSEYRAGAALFDTGTTLGPSEIGLLASQGYAQLEVVRRPRVAILPTGNELRTLDAPPSPYTIVDSNTYALCAALTRAGCIPVPLGIAGDDLELIERSIAQGLQCDALITVGGVSVGDYDLVGDALRAAGVRVDFHKVSIKPGKPLLFGMYDRSGRPVPVIGLPGNPVSALVVFEIFVRPGLLRMQGVRNVFPQTLDVKLAGAYRRRPGRTEFIRAQLQHESGEWLAYAHAQQGSGALSSLTAESALVIAPKDCGDLKAGDRLQAIVQGLPRRADPGFAG